MKKYEVVVKCYGCNKEEHVSTNSEAVAKKLADLYCLCPDCKPNFDTDNPTNPNLLPSLIDEDIRHGSH